MTSKDQRQRKRLAQLGAKRAMPTPEGEARMSAVILEVAEPMLRQHGSNAERAKAVLMLVVAGWNKTLLPPEQQPTVEKEVIDLLVPQDGSAEAVAVAVDIMDRAAQRREELFPGLRKVIVDYEVEIGGGRLTLNVSSAPVPEAAKP
jgi:hypothetical protein